MTEATIYVPKAADEKVLSAVLSRAADEFGGFTTVDAQGGWMNDDDELIKEPVTLVKVAGAGENWAESTANWVSGKTDENSVMWQVSDKTTGFQ